MENSMCSHRADHMERITMIKSISAVTLAPARKLVNAALSSPYRRVIAAGYQPDTAPRDAEWGERFFHLTDPDGHELSFAWLLHSS
jgi:uncharacterized glyoxalase superfamily protein PhnB